MSKHDAELRRRLQSGEPIEKTRRWFCECVVNDHIDYGDLSPLERIFYHEMVEAFRRWKGWDALH